MIYRTMPHEPWPLTIHTGDTKVELKNRLELEKTIYQFEAARQIEAVEQATSRSMGEIIHFFAEAQSPFADHPSFEILRRFGKHPQQTKLEPPHVYGDTQTAVLRYTHENDTAKARFDLDTGNVALLNFSTNKLNGLKVILLPTDADETSLPRLGELTGNEWEYKFMSRHEPDLSEFQATTEQGLENIFTRVGTIDIPMIGIKPDEAVMIPLDIFMSTWGE